MLSAVIGQLQQRVYATSVHVMPGYVELHAVRLPEGEAVHIAGVEGDDDEEVYRAACVSAPRTAPSAALSVWRGS